MILLDYYLVGSIVFVKAEGRFSEALATFTSAVLTGIINQLKSEIATGSHFPE